MKNKNFRQNQTKIHDQNHNQNNNQIMISNYQLNSHYSTKDKV